MGKKWNQDAKPAAKLLSLYTLLLFSGREASLGELSRELNCSNQAVMRLLDQLEASRFGKLLRARRGREAVYRLDRPGRLPRISLNAEGLQQLALCRDFMLHLLPESMRKKADAALQQASAYLPEEEAPDALIPVGESFAKGRIDYAPFQEMLQAVMTGIRQHRVCRVHYRSSIHGETKAFEFAPKRLVSYHETIYILGWIVSEKGTVTPLHEDSTTLALQRMRKVLVTRRSAARIPDVKEECRGAFGLIEESPFPVRVRFSPAAATYVAERQWSEGQKITVHRNGSVTLGMTARSSAEVISWVLSFAGTAELLSPKWLREELARHVMTLAARYQKTEKAAGRTCPCSMNHPNEEQ